MDYKPATRKGFDWKELLRPTWRKLAIFILYPTVAVAMIHVLAATLYQVGGMEDISFGISLVLRLTIINFEGLVDISDFQPDLTGLNLWVAATSVLSVLSLSYKYLLACVFDAAIQKAAKGKTGKKRAR